MNDPSILSAIFALLVFIGFACYETWKLFLGIERIYVAEPRLFKKGEIITHTSGQDYEIRDIQGNFLVVTPVRGNHVEG